MKNDSVLSADENKPFYGFQLSDEDKNLPLAITYEVWENFQADKVVAGERKKYVPGILAEEQLDRMILFWKKLGEDLVDPVYSIQLDKNGGSTMMYRYTKNKKVPPNVKFPVKKPIFEKAIEKLTIWEEPGKSFVFHTTLRSRRFADDVKYFASLIEKIAFAETLENIFKNESDFQAYELPELRQESEQRFLSSNTFVIDRRKNK